MTRAILDKTGKSINKPCIFPFIYKNKLHTKCATNKKGKWCATKVNSKKEMTEYGFCETKLSKTQKKGVSSGIQNNANVQNNRNERKKSKTQKKTTASLKPKTKRIKKHDIDSMAQQLNNLNNNALVVPDSLVKYVRPIEDQLRLKLWENPTRVNFLNWFDESFKRYRVRRKKTSDIKCQADDECNEVVKSSKHKKRELFNHQKIVRDYLNLESPYRGIIVYHGLGVGKTCSSIAIAEGFKTERQIVVILQKSIKQNYISQLKECGDMYFRHQNFWEFVRTTTTDKINFALKLGIPKKVLKREGGCFLIDFSQKAPNYDDMTEHMKNKLEEQIDDMIDAKYQFVHSNGLTATQLDRMEANNFFDNKVVVIDEVHNLINGMASEGSMRSVRLNELFMSCNNTKFVFLSGTPMKNVPFEIAKLYNILRGPIEVDEIRVSNSMTNGHKVDFVRLEKVLQNNKMIDQVIIQPKSKVIKLTRNPYGFVRSDDGSGLMKSRENEVIQQVYLENLEVYLLDHGYQMKSMRHYQTTLFPDNNKDFMSRFYNAITNSINDMETFRRRIIGMTSYYSSVDASLVPSIRTKQVIKVPMSDYMFDQYAEIRKDEIDKDKTSKKGKDDIMSVNSSYRAYSRMLCQFVFPETIDRPFKGKMKDIEVREEDLEKEKELELAYEEKISKTQSRDKIQELKAEKAQKLKELKNISQEYEKRLQQSLRDLDDAKDLYLEYDDGNKNKLAKYSPKYAKIMEQVLRDRNEKKKGLKFIYTEYKTCEGVGIFSLVLRANGYTPLKVKKNASGEYVLDLIKGEEHLPKFAVWSGDEESDIILSIYNDFFDKLPETIKSQVKKMNSTNKHGEVLEILMTTKQGAEGLNTRNVRQLHVVEPYWNPVRLDQVIGRAVRISSHLELPKEERNVDIYIYLSKAKTSQLKRNITMANDAKGTGKTSDEVLYDIAERKRHIMNIMLGMMKDSAIDCSINLADNMRDDSKIKCLHLASKNNHSYTHNPDLVDELKKSERDTRVQTVKQIFKPIIVKRKNDKMKVYLHNDKIYDFEAVESGRQGRPIGEITVNSKGKKTIKFY